MNIRDLNYKKIGMIAMFILISLALIYAIVRIFFVDDSAPETAFPDIDRSIPVNLPFIDPSAITPVGLPDTIARGGDTGPASTIARGGRTIVENINSSRIVAPTALRNGQDVAYYDPRDGMFYRLSEDGKNRTLLTDEQFFSVESVTWSASKQKAFIEFPDGANIMYDFTNRQTTSLPQEIVDPAFAEGSDNLVFRVESDNTNENWIAFTDGQTGTTRLIQPVGENGDNIQTLFSPDEQIVALFRKPVGPSQEEVFFIGQSGQNFRSLIVDGFNFEGVYSPSGRYLLYHVISSAHEYNPTLWVVDARINSIGDHKRSLGLSTWIDKCTFTQDGQAVYCAVPRSLSTGAGLSNDVLKTTDDVFYRIDILTGIPQFIAEPAMGDAPVPVAVQQLWLDGQEFFLYFWDARTGRVFKMRVK